MGKGKKKSAQKKAKNGETPGASVGQAATATAGTGKNVPDGVAGGQRGRGGRGRGRGRSKGVAAEAGDVNDIVNAGANGVNPGGVVPLLPSITNQVNGQGGPGVHNPLPNAQQGNGGGGGIHFNVPNLSQADASNQQSADADYHANNTSQDGTFGQRTFGFRGRGQQKWFSGGAKNGWRGNWRGSWNNRGSSWNRGGWSNRGHSRGVGFRYNPTTRPHQLNFVTKSLTDKYMELQREIEYLKQQQQQHEVEKSVCKVVYGGWMQ